MTWGQSSQSGSRAILHIDGDAFFASCEAALDPYLKGKCVVTGLERGIASSMSYEAKKRGVTRGMVLSDIRKVCPEAIILPSDYETYSLFSKRMFEIVRRYTPEVEEYSIDECFADLTGLRSPFGVSYEGIAARIKKELQSELGMTFSVGLAPTKVLAKVASKWRKPDGLTVIRTSDIPIYLKDLPAEKVWGIGPNTSAYFRKLGIISAFDLIAKEEPWVNGNLSKPFREIWRELRGENVYAVVSESKRDYQSISKTRTFTPPSSDTERVFSELSKNIENACIKARRHGLCAAEAFVFLKTQDFRYRGIEFKFSLPTSVPQPIIAEARARFGKIWRDGEIYRATGVVLMKLSGAGGQQDLFGESVKADAVESVIECVDAIDRKYGKHTVYIGSSMKALSVPQHAGDRSSKTRRAVSSFAGETSRRRVAIPLLGEVR